MVTQRHPRIGGRRLPRIVKTLIHILEGAVLYRSLSAVALAVFLLPVPLCAQIRASEAATVSQTVDGTVITVAYSRPQMRGRQPGVGGVFHHEHMWTIGANWATTLEVNRPIRLNGNPVEAWKYSVWTEPGETGWTMHLNPDPRLFHTMGPKAETMAVSFDVVPDKAEHVEVLTFDFPEVRRDGATLRFRWAEVEVPLKIEVEPTRNGVALTEEQVAPYVGSWTVQFINETNQTSPEIKMEILLANGSLRAIMDGPQAMAMEFVPTDEPHKFLPAFLGDDGQVLDVEAATPLVFEIVNGKAMSWKTLGLSPEDPEPWMWGTRRK
ncbi:MAG: DUF2911 domain-containing protein [Gemmatimonadales bacterium]|nr:MAG: DUF2911 domain-containing protein [Gemmatimonadales bacterium]